MPWLARPVLRRARLVLAASSALAAEAEAAGWDGVFVWEAGYGVDAWTLLAAIAARTSRIRLGTMLTPLPWRRPWKVASQVATLDQISGGRAILAVGIGAIGGVLAGGSIGDALLRRGHLNGRITTSAVTATVSSSLMNPRSVWCSSVSIEITIPASSGLSRWWAT